MVSKTTALLKAGEKPVTIVCLGDSITGVYYHTGGRRAYCDLLGLGLRRVYPKAKLVMINAGISGDTTEGALRRLDTDVLQHHPQLVTVMFGMNDVVRVSRDRYRHNLQEIVTRCRGVGAEVVLGTPNSVYPEDENRPMERLAQFAETVREVAREMEVPLADGWKAYEGLRAREARDWMVLMSEIIHPNMNGHRVFAEEFAKAISGRRVSLKNVGPPVPLIPRTLARLAAGETVRVTAMPPFDTLIGPALKRLVPGASVETTTWPVAGQTLAQIEAYARDNVGWGSHRSDPRPDLVLLAVPAEATAENEERFIRSYSEVLNWSISYVTQEWDCLAVLPSVTKDRLSKDEKQREALARRMVQGHDFGFLQRPAGDKSSAEDLFGRWIKQQLRDLKQGSIR